ncbi:hypothetical protein BpHYR1_016105 [Brachionus plicatilis]|uniref:Uncharacterized protein n=1 Tax=Brachionus plicatilis TaxID=10195 RepID=A0A3M7QSG9_BRAPC|nr:hypothetical protein BpHYR1_016105 [Brachionus plicatilis]
MQIIIIINSQSNKYINATTYQATNEPNESDALGEMLKNMSMFVSGKNSLKNQIAMRTKEIVEEYAGFQQVIDKKFCLKFHNEPVVEGRRAESENAVKDQIN